MYLFCQNTVDGLTSKLNKPEVKNQWTGGRYEKIIKDEAQRNTGQNMEKLLRHMKNSIRNSKQLQKGFPKADNMRMGR